jgi:predicted ferric reductase
MSQQQISKLSSQSESHASAWLAAGVLLVVALTLGVFLISPLAAGAQGNLTDLFALSSENVTWYVIRSAGITAYLLLWFSTVWGLAIPTKIFDRYLNGNFTFDFHKFISLLSLGFLGLHIFTLLVDNYLPFTWTQILVPFMAPYRPVWVGIGVIALYLTLLVTVTFYMRNRIGMKTFRVIHYTSLIAYFGAIAHAFFSGTDSSLPAAILMYGLTLLVVVFLTVYWLYMAVRK